VKTLTLYQPWASLVVDGRKDKETRPRPLGHRGYLAIHAGLKIDREACVRFGYDPDTIPRGAVLGVVNMVDCLSTTHPAVKADDYGDYRPGRYAYFLELVQKFEYPKPARGYQCLWDWGA